MLLAMTQWVVTSLRAKRGNPSFFVISTTEQQTSKGNTYMKSPSSRAGAVSEAIHSLLRMITLKMKFTKKPSMLKRQIAD
jgi:hypothetical protein